MYVGDVPGYLCSPRKIIDDLESRLILTLLGTFVEIIGRSYSLYSH